MSTKYSKKIISKLIDDEDGPRKYQANKLGAYEVSLEGFKIIKAMTPSAGVGIDAIIGTEGDIAFLGETNTVSGMFQLLAENLTPEHYTELVDKLLGSLMFNGEDIEDWSDHFDEYPQDFLEVLAWLGKETFTDFFVKSTILKPLIGKIKMMVLPKIKESLGNVMKLNEQDSNEELSETQKSN